MSALSSLLDAVGLGSLTGSTQPSGYTFSQQQKDFLLAQFKLALAAKRAFAAGEITKQQFESDMALAQQQLDAPYDGFWQEFTTAVNEEDLQWLAGKIGMTVKDVTAYMGNLVGSTIANAISGVTTGVAKGFFGNLNLAGWVAIGGIGILVFYGFKTGTIQKVFKRL